MIKRILIALVYSNVFIAFCAVLMVNQTYHFLLHTQPDIHYLLFVFFSTICSYSFHWYLTANSVIPSYRIEWIKNKKLLFGVLFFIGFAGAAFFFFYLLPWWPLLSLSAVVTFLYSAPKIPHKYFRSLRRVALGKTIFLAFVWMYVTVMLPIFISPLPWQNHYIFFILSQFFLIYSICILFDYRDREDDREAGIRSLITYLDEKKITYLFICSLVIFGVSTAMLLRFGYPTLEVLILLLPGIITACLYDYVKSNFSDFFYYLVLDGLMALSAVLLLIPGI